MARGGVILSITVRQMQLASYLLIGHVELGGELLFQVVKLLLKSISLLLQGQALDLKLLTQFLQRKKKTVMVLLYVPCLMCMHRCETVVMLENIKNRIKYYILLLQK